MVTALPTGVVAFLFTDVEGSTRLWEIDRSKMAASLELHDQILRARAERFNGHVFSTAGDSFAIAFHNSVDAIKAALEIQRELRAADWPGPALSVRAGLHDGTAEERNGDYFGPALNRAARLMSAGHGGQVLMSAAVAELVDRIDDHLSVRDLGTHRLKDLDEPEHVYELVHPDLPPVDRPLRTVDVRRHNLPDYLTSFIGRDVEVADVQERLANERLIVLTGVGGTGKTRLAVEVARTVLPRYPDGVWLAELAPVTSKAFVASTIGEIWGLLPSSSASIEQVLVRHLAPKQLLVIFDNCEHVLSPATAVVKLLLDNCPGVTVLATSRESLGVSGESIVHVPSLALPDETDTVEESDAARLFLDRALAVRTDFDPTGDDLYELAAICTRLDGIPLGLELAAARVRSMTLAELRHRLELSFRVLSGSAKAALPRQRTLHAAIDWSYELLSPDEQAVFVRLAVFTGGFDIEAAHPVAGADAEDIEMLDLVDSLVDKSLLVAEPSRATTRYRMLEPVRQFAQETLADSGGAEATRDAHARYFLDLAERAAEMIRGPNQAEWVARVDDDYENMRTALDTLKERGDLAGYLDLAFHLFTYWMRVGLHTEGIAAGLEVLESATDIDLERQVRAWWTIAVMGAELTQPESVDHARRGLEIATRTNDPGLVGKMHLAVGAALRHSTDDPAYLGHLVQGRRTWEEHAGPMWWEPEWERAFMEFLLAAYLSSEDPRRRTHHDNALAGFLDLGDEVMQAAALSETAFMDGLFTPEETRRNLDDAIETLERHKAPYWLAHALVSSGMRITDPAESIDVLLRAAGHLEDAGDLSCWSAATRFAALAENRSGNVDSARVRLSRVIESLPDLPFREAHTARTLDATAEVLATAGRFSDAAVALGRAKELTTPESYMSQREESWAKTEARLLERLDSGLIARLQAEGVDADTDKVLERLMAVINEG